MSLEDSPAREGAWATNTTPDEIAAWLAEASRVLVLTHAKPDGDAVGSSIALVRALRRVAEANGRDPALIEARFAGPTPAWLDEIAAPGEASHLERKPLPAGESEPDAIVIVDTGARKQLESAGEFVAARAERVAIIDHHLGGDAELGHRRLLDTTAAAAAVPVAEVCVRLLGVDGPADLDTSVAEPLYLGLATDTGWFRHSNVRPRAFRLAADLVEAGVEHPRLFELVEQRDRPNRLRLLGRMLAKMELHANDRLAILPVSLEDVHETGVRPGESSGFAELALAIASVRTVAVLTETDEADEPMVKMSLRSKPDGDAIDVNELAQRFGGGGHARAAGARAPGTMEQVKAQLVEAVQAMSP